MNLAAGAMGSQTGDSLYGPSSAASLVIGSKIQDVIRRTCPTESLKDKQLIDVLVIGGGNLANFCECLATRFAAQVDYAEYGNENALNRKWADSRNLCLVMSIK
jgi:hypothetical protein